jgi:L-lactate dehydrogenase complex protein LldG
MAPVKPDQGAREEILGRVREALKSSAPKLPPITAGPIFAPVENLLERFQREAAANYMEVKLAADAAGTITALREIIASLPEGEIFVQDTPQLRQLAADTTNGRPLRWSSQGAPAESSRATISVCEGLVALTGSVLVSSGGCGGRGISVVAPCHIVVAHVGQLFPDLESAVARARQIAFDNSYVGLITGCSRTSDIEKKLIIGAHGPQRLVVIMQTQTN